MAFERALAKQPKTDVPDGARCYVCLDGGDVLRGCACRGPSAGFAHAGCLAEMAARDEWITSEGRGPLSRWTHCGTCNQWFVGALEVEMSRRCWRRYRDPILPDVLSDDDQRQAFRCGAGLLRCNDENDAADRLSEAAVRGLASDHHQVLKSEIERAASVVRTNPDAGLEILTRLRPRVARCTAASVPVEYASLMAVVLGALNRPREALPAALESVELATAYHGPESATTLRAMDTLARVVAQLGRVDEGIARLKRVHDTQTRVLGADHRDTRQTKRVLDEEAALERARPS